MKRLLSLLGLLVLMLLLAGYSCSITAFQPEATATPPPTDSFELSVRVADDAEPEWGGTAFEIEGGQVGIMVASKWWPTQPFDISVHYGVGELKITGFRDDPDLITPRPVVINECPADELPGLIWTLVELDDVVICVGEEAGKQRPFSGRDNLTEKEFTVPATAEPE